MNRFHSVLVYTFLSWLATAVAAPTPNSAPTRLTPATTDKPRSHPPSTEQLSAVQVTAHVNPDAGGIRLQSYGDASLHDTPASITDISHTQLQQHQIRTVSQLTHEDASLGDAYAAVGYYQNLQIRGFPLDLATGYRMNNLTIAGEQRMGMEEVQHVQVLKGLAGIDAGVMEPGGVINYVTKRPANVHSLMLGIDSYGSRYSALDVGQWLTSSFGLRANVAWENTHPYVRHTDGRRAFYSLAADWLISDRATLELNGDYQVSSQRSVSGYQLLGGITVPHHVDPRRLLGYQPWGPPVGIHSTNWSAHLNYQLLSNWQLDLATGHSRSVIDDETAFAYGCFTVPECQTPRLQNMAFFAPDGDYGVWDYRSPDDGREDDQARITLGGHFDTGTLRHDLTFGLSAFRRAVTNRVALFEQVGTANIHDAEPPVFSPSADAPGPRAPRLDSRQITAFALDRVHLTEHWQVIAGLRLVRLHELAWNAEADPDYALQRDSHRATPLPQVAVLWQPDAALTTYLSYSQGLALGKQAPYWTTNANVYLAPRLARQYEGGVKYRWHHALDLNAAVFRIGAPYQFGKADHSSAGFSFVQQGEEVHTGLDLSANGAITQRLSAHASVEWMRAHAHGTGDPANEGHQVQNVPALRTTIHLTYRLPWLTGLGVLGGWRYASPNPALPNGSASVSAYNVFDTGLIYHIVLYGHGVVLNLNVDNLLNHFYWRSTSSDGSDNYLFPGAPRMLRFTARIDL